MKYGRSILVCLLLGVIANLTVAWGIALKVNVMDKETEWSGGAEILDNDSWALSRYDSTGTMMFVSERARGEYPENEPNPFADNDPPSVVRRDWAPLEPPTDAYLQAEFQHGQIITEFQRFEARGWPLLSFWCYRGAKVQTLDIANESNAIIGPEISVAARGFIETSFEESNPFKKKIALPYLPIWRGLVINSALYGGLLWIGFIMFYCLARFIRHKPGTCHSCGYDLQGVDHAACPECGHTCSGARKRKIV